jgi:membrane associated rhomboid family serine protease
MVYELEDDKVPFFSQFISVAIILINIIVFIIQLFDPTGYMLIYDAAFIPSEFFAGKKTWTIFTSMWMHADFYHIFMNMFFFYVVSDNCEKAMGHIYFLISYLISGLVGSFLHAFIALVTGLADIPSLGASGAVMGVVAIYGILFPRNRLRFYFVGTVSARTFIFIMFITELIYGIISLFYFTGTAHFAHIGGFIMGVIFAYFLKLVKRDKYYGA